jgi:hypothetical protein
MNERPSAGSGVVGYMIVLVGVAAFVLSCFVPYTQFFNQVSISYYRLATASRGGTLEYVGGLLLLFGGTATVAWVALRWTPTWPTRALADALDPSSRHRCLVLVVDRRSSQSVGTL